MMTQSDIGVPRLIVTHPPEHRGRVLFLSQPDMVVGHSETADLILDDRYVSRRHALISVTPSGAVTIHDLNSTGGTFVNDERVEGVRTLQADDVVRFAELVTRFEPARAQRDETTVIMPTPPSPPGLSVTRQP